MPGSSVDRLPEAPTPLAPVTDRQLSPPPLPHPITPLVGRAAETAAATAMLGRDDVRLVTLTGPGGVGKTRLALQVAAELELGGDFADGVAFIPLAPVTDPALVLPVIAETLKVHGADGTPALDRLGRAIRRRRLLLVLDNVEHLIGAGPHVAALLAACPGLRILTTSRVAMRLSGEQRLAVPPLALPASPEPSLAEIAESEAVILFVERARAVDPGFCLSAASAGSVVEICRHLDGLPLAIELAAPFCSALSPPALLARLEPRLSLLVGGPRDLPMRQQTLRATIAWSHDLLDRREKVLFRRLAVFTNGFTLDAAEQVIGDGAPPQRVLAGVATLVDKSLLRRADAPDGDPRYAMLETVREFGLERLAASGEADAVRRRAAAYFVTLVEYAVAQLGGPGQRRWLARIEADLDNLKSLMTWAADAGEAESLMRVAGALSGYWMVRGRLREGRAYLERAIQLGETCVTSERARATAYFGLGKIATYQGDLAIAERRLAEALALFRRLNDPEAAARALGTLGGTAELRGDDDLAARRYEECLRLFRELGHDGGTGSALENLGDVAFRRGDYPRAGDLAAEALALSRQAGDDLGVVLALVGVAQSACERGDLGLTATSLGEALTLARQRALEPGVADTFAGIARLASVTGRPETAARMLGAADLLSESTGAVRWLHEALHRRTERAARDALGEAAYVAAWNAGRSVPFDEILATAEDLVAHDIPSGGPAPLPDHQGVPLTARERDVLGLLTAGLTDREIATALSISPHTASTHVRNLLGKLGVATRTAAVAQALRDGLIETTHLALGRLPSPR